MSQQPRGLAQPATAPTQANTDGVSTRSTEASVDVEALVAEIKAEVARKAEEGLYPPELMVELAASSSTR